MTDDLSDGMGPGNANFTYKPLLIYYIILSDGRYSLLLHGNNRIELYSKND